MESFVKIMDYKNVSQGRIRIEWSDEHPTSWFPTKVSFDRFFCALCTTKFEVDLDLSKRNNKRWDMHQLDQVLRALSKPNSVKKLAISAWSDRFAIDIIVPKLLVRHVEKLHVEELASHIGEELFSEPGFVEAICQNYEITRFMSIADQFFGIAGFGEEAKKVTYALDLNYGGRRILKHEPMPLNLLPLILERADSRLGMRSSNKCDIIYHLIRGKVGQICG